MKLTDHFTLEELTTTTTKYSKLNIDTAKKHEDSIYKLALFAEQVRAILNCPMTITSGYRCTELNTAIKGAKNSQHTKFEAIDFVTKKYTIDEIFNILKNSNLVYGQLIKEQSGTSKWVHVSMGHKKENLMYKDGKYTTIL